jgi:predicted metalloprotease with PDZ domain
MANEWWRIDPETLRQGFGIVYHRLGDNWVVHQTLVNSPAHSAGVMSGDVLYSIAGVPFDTKSRPTILNSTIDLLRAGVEHEIAFSRTGQLMTFKMLPKILRDLFEAHADNSDLLVSCYSCPSCFSRPSGVASCPSDCPGYNCTTG